VIQKLPIETRRQTTLGGGDLYELCFTAAVSKRVAIEHIGRTLNVRLTRIGQIVERSGLTVLDAARNEIKALPDSYDHFKEPA
jgi:thiamine-monophosphate kinase